MIRRFKDWLFRWRAQRRLAIHRNGWNWAAGALLLGTPTHIVEAQVENGSFFDDPADDVKLFDEGAREAIAAWVALLGEAT